MQGKERKSSDGKISSQVLSVFKCEWVKSRREEDVLSIE